MPRPFTAVAAAIALLCGLAYAEAAIVITVDKSAQRLTVAVNGAERYEWPVSTARRGYLTPNGTYHPERLERKWFSRKYDWSPMPYSIFFHGGYAIHGSYEISRIGTPASHGCIRLHPEHAAVLFKLVKRNMADTRIVVKGERPAGRTLVEPRRDMSSEEQSAQAKPAQRGSDNSYQSFNRQPAYQPWPGFNPSQGNTGWSPEDAAANATIARKRWENMH